MLKLPRNWPLPPIALPRSGASTGGFTLRTAWKPLRSSITSKTFAAIISVILSSENPARDIVVEGIEITLPGATAIPLGFIANELITNAAKYGAGRITVRLESDPEGATRCRSPMKARVLPEKFDPAARKGLGMRIIQSLVGQIGGELEMGQGDKTKVPDLRCRSRDCCGTDHALGRKTDLRGYLLEIIPCR